MDFPALSTEEIACPPGLEAALGASPVFVGKSRFDLLVELADEEILRGLRPARDALLEIPTRGVITTAVAEPRSGVDFVSRFFAPAAGIEEDPVTGSAHCVLGPYWAGRLGRHELLGYQASRRGGTVGVAMNGSRVVLSGQAVTVTLRDHRLTLVLAGPG